MSDRNLRRLAGKKNAQDLAKAIHGIKELTTGLRNVVPEAQEELEAARGAIREWRDELASLQYQLDRQRAVFLRMIRDLGIAIPDHSETILALEATYGAEYDAMRFLCWVAMLGAGEDP